MIKLVNKGGAEQITLEGRIAKLLSQVVLTGNGFVSWKEIGNKVLSILYNRKPKKYDIDWYVRVPRLDNKLTQDVDKSELQDTMQKSFATRGMKVVEDFLEYGSQNYPKNLSFFVYTRDKSTGNLVSGLIATVEKVAVPISGNAEVFEFTYYDKIFVSP